MRKTYVTELNGGASGGTAVTEDAISMAVNTIREILGRGKRVRVAVEELTDRGDGAVYEEHAGIKIRAIRD